MGEEIQYVRFMAGICAGGGLLVLVAVYLATGSTGRTVRSAAKPAQRLPVPTEAPWFADATETLGINFRHDAGTPGNYFMPETVGSGAALFDLDNDGRLDLYLLQNGGPDSGSTNRLYRQGADGKFVDISKGSGLDVSGYGMGVAAGDVSNDGLTDVLVTEYGRTRLFLNQGGGRFLDVSKQAGIDNPLWGTSAAFLDYDRDGWLDIAVVNYVEYDPKRACSTPSGRRDFCGPSAFTGTATRLYRNLGSGAGGKAVSFGDMTVTSGVGTVKGPGLGIVCLDFTGDRWTDILVANDGHPNHLWVNQHDGTFREEGAHRGIAYDSMGGTAANMGIAVGDVDGDGLADVFITHLMSESHNCWKQGPPGTFQDMTAAFGLNSARVRSTGFGTLLGDFDRDGSLDLALANGGVRRPEAGAAEPPLSAFWSTYRERNQILANDGKGRFRDISVSNPAFCGTPAVARGLACGDIDNDGALDLVVTRVADSAKVYRNVAPNPGHWLMVRAVEPKRGGRDAYGSEVSITVGGKPQTRTINPGYSYVCSNDPRAHFGLGSADRVESLEVIWADGSEERFPCGRVDRLVVLRKGEGQAR